MKLLHSRWCASLLAGACLSRGAELYVAPNGNDDGSGAQGQPFGSLERARGELRRLKQDPGHKKESLTVWLRGGDYLRTNAFELTGEDSGTSEAPVTWRSVPGEHARLLGGRPLSGFEPVSDQAIKARLRAPARDHVLQLSLRKLGISDFGEMKSRGFGRPGTPSHCELFFNSKPMTLARWPNEGGFEKIAGFPEATGQADEHGGKIGKLENGFYYSGERPQSWKDINDVWVHGYWAWDWANSYEHVASIDSAQHLIKTEPPYGQYGFRKGQRFYFLNVLEELDEPGEWFLDRKAGMLYFWPPARLESSSEILLSLCAMPLLKLTDTSHVTFRGVTLEACRADAVDITGGTSNRLEGCLIRNIGDSGVSISGGAGHGVIGCDIFDTGDGGVSLSGGNRQTLEPAGHFVVNCHFARQGRWSKCYVPAILLSGVGMRASHNLIHDHPHCAILFSGNEHLIDFNEIHHIALETGDVGAIYTGRDYTFRGNRIQHNYIHHTGGVGMGSMGVYMDDCVSGTEISGNIFYKVQRAAFLGGGRDHQVLNNIFVDCNYAVELDGRGLDKSPVWHSMVDDTMRKRLQDVPLAIYRDHYPEMRTLDAYYGAPGDKPIVGEAFHGVPPEGNLVARNVCVGKWLNVYWNAKLGMLHLENNVTNAESCFVRQPEDGSKATDFELKSDCAVWALGFQKIPADKIGMYR
ncbi:MAG TPA: right-handed parallel beta-helix repeat-containing protein, partial [Verrucomicrobiae bacterium]|nr:right-handed parallel beta-helix repeat-containing protein [Verrucomicrobiae bacterium]